ncbi:MAG: ubiquitin-conjugating enzyme E2 [Flavobacterium sp.]
MSIVISKETIHRLMRDIKQIVKHPLTEQGIYYVHDDTDMMKGYAMIVGPSDTPYFGGFYFFEFEFPRDYPHSPPKVTYCTNGENIRFNPNLYTCGKVCVSILNTWTGDQWTSCQTISTVLLTLCTLLTPVPMLNEPGVLSTHPDVVPYSRIIEYANIHTAVCDMITQKPGIYLPFFTLFYNYMKERFLANYDTMLTLVKKRASESTLPGMTVTTDYYEMCVHINYQQLEAKLMSAREFIS